MLDRTFFQFIPQNHPLKSAKSRYLNDERRYHEALILLEDSADFGQCVEEYDPLIGTAWQILREMQAGIESSGMAESDRMRLILLIETLDELDTAEAELAGDDNVTADGGDDEAADDIIIGWIDDGRDAVYLAKPTQKPVFDFLSPTEREGDAQHFLELGHDYRDGKNEKPQDPLTAAKCYVEAGAYEEGGEARQAMLELWKKISGDDKLVTRRQIQNLVRPLLLGQPAVAGGHLQLIVR